MQTTITPSAATPACTRLRVVDATNAAPSTREQQEPVVSTTMPSDTAAGVASAGEPEVGQHGGDDEGQREEQELAREQRTWRDRAVRQNAGRRRSGLPASRDHEDEDHGPLPETVEDLIEVPVASRGFSPHNGPRVSKTTKAAASTASGQ